MFLNNLFYLFFFHNAVFMSITTNQETTFYLLSEYSFFLIFTPRVDRGTSLAFQWPSGYLYTPSRTRSFGGASVARRERFGASAQEILWWDLDGENSVMYVNYTERYQDLLAYPHQTSSSSCCYLKNCTDDAYLLI